MDPNFTFNGVKHSRRHTIAPVNLGALLPPDPSGAAPSPTKPLPQGNMRSPASSVSSTTVSHPSPNSFPFDSAARSPADDVSARQLKRLSLNFPIQAAATGSRSRPQSWYGTPVPSPDIPQTPTAGNFLTALAAQERKVLELKEELQKAEQDLQSLKKQWASHEASRKRNDIRSVHPLQPLNTSLANMVGLDDDDNDGSSLWQKEMERRRALLAGTKTSQRKVFSGSRHTRQLSLLSPDKTFIPSFPQPVDLSRSIDPAVVKPGLNRSATTATDAVHHGPESLTADNKDVLLRASKQFATDFKDGLLTFIEDLRQATVGEEAADPNQVERPRAYTGQASKLGARGAKQTRPARPQSLTFQWDGQKSGPDNSTLIDIGGSFWKEHGLDEPASSDNATRPLKLKSGSKSKISTRTPPQKPSHKTIDDSEESWDNWDSPSHSNEKQIPSSSSIDSASEGRTTPISGRSSTRTSTSSAGLPANTFDSGYDTPARNSKRDSITWSTLDKLSPTNLKRTASHLMKEWERSLIASPPTDATESKEGKHD